MVNSELFHFVKHEHSLSLFNKVCTVLLSYDHVVFQTLLYIFQNFLWLFKNPRAFSALGIIDLVRPTPEWGPALQEHREQSVRYNTRLGVIDILGIKDIAASTDDGESRNADVTDPNIAYTNVGFDTRYNNTTESHVANGAAVNSIDLDLGGDQNNDNTRAGSHIYSVI